ncbi:nicotinate-nucleotide--dimethylbenzimidazole phosphoribosyltransferase [Streptomyces sp. NPDC005805]|uniref:nicotinate-nucleotide--dimethylbenzimidazole phosphoribosyltransferase n=1 Tax=Streptomyces sp. NPDC005805 TaxID=3157068 RepID=UPI003408B659
MTDTGQVPGEGQPENAGMVEQPGVPAPGAYTYLEPSGHTAEEDDLLLMPGAQGAWSEHTAAAPAATPPHGSLVDQYVAAQASVQHQGQHQQQPVAAAPQYGAEYPAGPRPAPAQEAGVPAPAEAWQTPAAPEFTEVTPAPQPPAGAGYAQDPAGGGPEARYARDEYAQAAEAQYAQAAPGDSLAQVQGTMSVVPGVAPEAVAVDAAAAPEPVPAQPAPEAPDAGEEPVAPAAAEPADAQAPEPAPAAPVAEAAAPQSPEAVPDPAAHEPGAHETGGRDSGAVDLGAVRTPAAATSAMATPPPARRPLHMGPPVPDPANSLVRSLADRGPAGSTPPHPIVVPHAPAPQGATGVEYLDVPREEPGAHLPGPSLGDIPPQAGAPWDPQPPEAPAAPVPEAAAETVAPAAVTPEAAMAEAPAPPAEPAVPAPRAGEPAAPAAAAVADAAVPAQAEAPAAPPATEAEPETPAAAPDPADLPPAAEAQAVPVPDAPPVTAEAPAPAPEADALPLQGAQSQPAPVPATPEQALAPAAEPAPEAAAPEAVPAPEVTAAPESAVPAGDATPGAPATDPAPAAEVAPEPQPAPAPAADAPEPEPAPEPAPEADAGADPTPDPAPEAPAEPQPEPAPAPQAAPTAEETARAEETAPAEPEPVTPTGPPAPGYDEAEREAVLRVMRERRDIRNGFRSDPIPHEVLLRVLEAAHTAPSVGHSQPWDFVVIRSAETRRTMHELAQSQREAYAESLPKGRAKQFKELKIEAILDTPVNIVVTADPTRGGRHTLGRHTQPQMAPYSSALAVENLWLAARAEGLGVGWVSFFDEREMVRTLGLPDHLEVVAYLCVGYVDEFPEEPELMQAGWSKRRPLSWVVHEETYGRRALPGEEPHDLLQETVTAIRPLDAKALGEAWERQKRMTKPAGALGMLEIISAQLSGLSRMCPPPVPEPAAVAIFAGDHGVHAQGVTAWPQEVTGQMVANFLGGGAVCNAFAQQVGAEVCVVDVGVAADLPATPGLLPRKVRAGTADFTTGPALTREEVLAAIEVGIETARDLVAAGNKALLTGEMGIANTTTSAALISVYTGADPAEITGRGTGINDEMHARKVDVVRRALELHRPDPADPVGVLAAVGGLEHCALVGLILGGASLRTPVVLDGVSTGAAALVARAIAPEALAACIAGHRSAEPGHVAALGKLGLRPLVDLDLRLGEGTGALLALPIVQSAARAMHEVATFDSAGVTEK